MHQGASANTEETFQLLQKCLENQTAVVFVGACQALVAEPAGWLLGLGTERLTALRTLLHGRVETLDEEDKPEAIVALDRLAKAQAIRSC